MINKALSLFIWSQSALCNRNLLCQSGRTLFSESWSDHCFHFRLKRKSGVPWLLLTFSHVYSLCKLVQSPHTVSNYKQVIFPTYQKNHQVLYKLYFLFQFLSLFYILYITVQLFMYYCKFYSKQYPLPAVSWLASRGEQWLHGCYILNNYSSSPNWLLTQRLWGRGE